MINFKSILSLKELGNVEFGLSLLFRVNQLWKIGMHGVFGRDRGESILRRMEKIEKQKFKKTPVAIC